MNESQENPPIPVPEESGIVGPPPEIVSLQAVAWSAPLPAPADFQRYEEILPGAANRILEILERQQAHQHSRERMALEQAGIILDIERKAAASDSRRAYLGIASGLAITLLTIGGSIYLIDNGHDWAGLTLAGINLTGLAGVFVYGARNRLGRRVRLWRSQPPGGAAAQP